MTSVAIIDYGSGNLRSVAKAFERVAGNPSDIMVTRSPDDVAQATHIVLPGVGAFADCMAGLRALYGMLPMLREQVLQRNKSFLGICVGMQMLFEKGHEHGVHDGLGWFKGEVVPLAKDGNNASLKIPHMGWNDLTITGTHPLVNALQGGDHAYFVHSYYVRCGQPSDMQASTEYGQSIAAVVGRDNIMGTQFHPEKSQDVGLKLLKRFLEL